MAEEKNYTTPKTVSLPTKDLQWLDNEYPGVALSSVMVMLLRNFRRVHEDTGVTPNKAARDAAKEIKETLSEMAE